MICLLTSCGRHDLLKETLDSLFENQKYELDVTLHEDANIFNAHSINDAIRTHRIKFIAITNGIGQHASIEKFLKGAPDNKYYLHLEDDWLIDNRYDWIQASIDIMEADPTIIKVLARKDSPHPCNYDFSLSFLKTQVSSESGNLRYLPEMPYISEAKHLNENNEGYKSVNNFGYLQPWENDGINWRGFSFNPGVTRLDLLRQFVPFGKHEQDVAQAIYDADYKVVALEDGVYEHIGQNRSTHE